MRAMGGDAIPKEVYKWFLDLFTTTHEERVMVQAKRSPRKSSSMRVS